MTDIPVGFIELTALTEDGEQLPCTVQAASISGFVDRGDTTKLNLYGSWLSVEGSYEDIRARAFEAFELQRMGSGEDREEFMERCINKVTEDMESRMSEGDRTFELLEAILAELRK